MSRPRHFQDVLTKLPDARQSGDQWTASCPCPCPGHRTTAGHLTLKDAGDKVLVTCQGGKHTYQDISQALGFESLSYNGHTSTGQPCPSVQDTPKHVQKSSTGLVKQVSAVSNGINIETISKAKCISVDILHSFGLCDRKGKGLPAIEIPYYGESGAVVATRYRLALTGEGRFKWKQGSKVQLYGIDRLKAARAAGWVLLVEGESDCWTCWLHGIPALGVPGKGTWQPDWEKHIQGLQVYVWQEPDAEDFVLRILKSAPDLRYIQAPEGIKDISEAHIQGLDIPSWLEELKGKAESGQALKIRYTNEKLQQLYKGAESVIKADDPLAIIEGAIRGLGYGGDIAPALITYLSMTSRLLGMRDGSMPVHLLLTGPSSSGKSYTVGIIKRLMPAEAYHVIDAGSPHALIYDETPLEHKAIIFGEADSLPAGEDNPAASAIRNLLQDHNLHYQTVIKDTETGKQTTVPVNRAGPSVLITTSTRLLGDQLMTRLFNLEVPDSKEQISAALAMQASIETRGIKPVDTALVDFQSYLQLKAPVKVMVPFAKELSKGIALANPAPRINRDFARLISLVKVVALIRHYKRKVDSEGRIIAEIGDYKTVRALVNNMYINSSTGVTDEIRALVDAVRVDDRSNEKTISYSALARDLKLNPKQIERRAKAAMKAGWLVNKELRKHYPADLALGEPLPETNGLPELDNLDASDIERVEDSSFENKPFDSPTPLTDSNTPRQCLVDSTGYCLEDESPPKCSYKDPILEDCPSFRKAGN